MSRAGAHIRGLASGLLMLTVAAIGLLAWSGCDDPVDLCAPAVPSATIAGRVRLGGLTADTYVTARQHDDDYQTWAEFLAAPDATGAYSLAVPPGRYTVHVRAGRGRYDYTRSGPGYGRVPPDTLVLAGTEVIPDVDFDLGGVTLDLEVPHAYHGEPGTLFLVRYEDGEPIDDGSLALADGAEIVTGQVELAVAGVLPGDYRVAVGLGCQGDWCGGSSVGERFWLPGTHDLDEAPLYRVGPDSVLTLTQSFLGEPARLEGRVSGAWLELGSGEPPRVSFVTPDSSQTLRSRHVEEDGSFSAEFLVPGPVKLGVLQEGMEHWIGGSDFATATVFQLVPGETVSGVEFIQSGLLMVLDGIDGSLEYGVVRIHEGDGGSILLHEFYPPDAGRHTAIPNLRPGEYRIHLEPEDWMKGKLEWRPQWFDRAADPAQAQPVVLSTGEVARLDVVLETGGRIAGQVVRDGAPMPFARILIYPAGSDTAWADIYAWQGDFDIRGLPDGDYEFCSVPQLGLPPEDDTIWYPGTFDRQAAAVVEIRDAAVVTGADIIYPR